MGMEYSMPCIQTVKSDPFFTLKTPGMQKSADDGQEWQSGFPVKVVSHYSNLVEF